MTKLPVIFRAERSGSHKGDVTAVFPTLPGTSARDFTVYAHVGQHSTGTFPWYIRTRPARPDEYGPLLSELKRIYEPSATLVVQRRWHRAYERARQEAR